MKKLSLLCLIFMLCFTVVASAGSSEADIMKISQEEEIVVEKMRSLLKESSARIVALVEAEKQGEIELLPEVQMINELGKQYTNAYAYFLDNLAVHNLKSQNVKLEFSGNDHKVVVFDDGSFIELKSYVIDKGINPNNDCWNPQVAVGEGTTWGPHKTGEYKLYTEYDFSWCFGMALSYKDVYSIMNNWWPMSYVSTSASLISSSSSEIRTRGFYTTQSGVIPGAPLITHNFRLDTTIDNAGIPSHTFQEL